MTRQYGRDDVNYETWYSDWSKRLAMTNTAADLEQMLRGSEASAKTAAAQHLRAIERSSSMTGNSGGRAKARSSVSAASEAVIAIRGALEIYELFPEHTKSSKAPEKAA